MTFGEKIRFCRTSLGINQTELGETIGVSQRTIHSYEKLGAIPHKKNIHKLARALSVTEEFLFDNSQSDPGDDFYEECYQRELRIYIKERTPALMAGTTVDENITELFMESYRQVFMNSLKESLQREILD